MKNLRILMSVVLLCVGLMVEASQLRRTDLRISTAQQLSAEELRAKFTQLQEIYAKASHEETKISQAVTIYKNPINHEIVELLLANHNFLAFEQKRILRQVIRHEITLTMPELNDLL